MQSPSGNAVVRLSLGALFLATFAMALVQPVQAQDAEPFADLVFVNMITDDQEVPQGVYYDILSWDVAEPGNGTLVFRLTVADMATISPLPPTPTPAATLFGNSIDLFLTEPAAFRQGVNGNDACDAFWSVCIFSGNSAYMLVTYDAMGVDVGDTLTGPSSVSYFTSAQDYAPGGFYAPDGVTGPKGTDYPLTGCSNPAGCDAGEEPVIPGDSDGDGLNDTCEMKYFGNLTGTNSSSEDPDGDGLNNAEECAQDSDPTNPDSDGDGANDKDDPFPNDASQGGTNTTSTSSSTSQSTTSSSSSTSTSRSSTSVTGGADDSPGTCADSDTSDAVDCLESDVGYLGMSAGGFLAVLILCIIALATRWSL